MNIKLIFLIFFQLIFFLNLISADLLSVSVDSSVGELNQYKVYNLTLSNSGNPPDINLVQINITIPSVNFSHGYLDGQIFLTTLLGNMGVSDDGRTVILSNNSGLLSSGLSTYILFNASMNSIGKFNFTVSSLDSYSQINSTNFSITVNDTIAPSINFVSPTPSNNSQLNGSQIQAAITASDFGSGLATINIYLYNSSGLLGNSSNSSYTFQSLNDGTYYLNATARDISGRVNNTLTRIIKINNSLPCTENWTCGSWTSCSNGTQIRTCSDSNSCGTILNKPAVSQSCAEQSECISSWECTEWTPIDCLDNQTRICTDVNNCSSSNTETRVCTTEQTGEIEEEINLSNQSESRYSFGVFIFLVAIVIGGIIFVAFILFRKFVVHAKK